GPHERPVINSRSVGAFSPRKCPTARQGRMTRGPRVTLPAANTNAGRMRTECGAPAGTVMRSPPPPSPDRTPAPGVPDVTGLRGARWGYRRGTEPAARAGRAGPGGPGGRLLGGTGPLRGGSGAVG